MGLNFILPPPPASDLELRREFDRFDRTLRLKYHFREKDLEYLPSKNFKIPSAFHPPPGANRKLDHFLEQTQDSIIQHNCHKTRPKSNLPKALRDALVELQNNNEVIIKPADKGGAVVLWDRQAYIEEGNRQTSNATHYLPLAKDLTPEYEEEISSYLSGCHKRNLLDRRTAVHLMPKFSKTATLYLLPKIHKNQTPTPGRPIMSANDCPTEKISQYVDHFLKQFSPTVPSYIKDTSDFLRKIAEVGKVPAGTFLATVDVTSLYTNIPHKDGIVAARTYLRQRPDATPHTFVLLKLIRFILQRNCFTFNGRFFLQVQGTAMGTKMAPNYAILFMAQLEESFLQTAPYAPLVFWRYIDDIFILWQHGRPAWTLFIEALNNHHPTIKFTSETSETQLPFLDTLVHLRPDGSLETSLYTKPTDAHLYLHYKSDHPRGQLKNIPYGQFLRIRKICSRTEDFDTQATLMTEHFRARGYPRCVIQDAYRRAKEKNRDDLLQDTEPGTCNSIIYVHTYNNIGPQIRQILLEKAPILNQHPATQALVANGFLVALKRNKNLRDKLVRAALHQPQRGAPGCHPCRRPCKTCKYIQTTDEFVSHTTKKKYKIHEEVNCLTPNVIYLLDCSRCGQQYVGQTSNTFATRFLQHCSDIRHGKDTPVAAHFHLPRHDVTNVLATIIERVPGKTRPQRLRHEHAWIHELVTMQPAGINVQE